MAYDNQYSQQRASARDKLAAQVAAYRAKQAQDEANAQGEYEQYMSQQERQANEDLASPAMQGAQIGASFGGGYGALGGAAGGMGLGMLRAGIEAQKQGKSPFTAIGRGLLDIPKNLLGGSNPNAAANTASILSQQRAAEQARKTNNLLSLAERVRMGRGVGNAAPTAVPGASSFEYDDMKLDRGRSTNKKLAPYEG